ncbi:EF-hand calcium-binding domain-containing protein 1 [Desmophyllum pertusum]|uniref:EF-hand calcium-binding domain-containing protein 1 n=1 Tax=Desmophyllum pertusum TaxID=174260 RepID=A0A9W9YTB4_9CNID|nr:EF-hand calcium-binding domain-containing protein 1 [Desmophyllum pertusum]
MASITARRNQEKIAESLYKDTHFAKQEVISLLEMYETLTKVKNDKMDRTKFRDILYNNFGLTEDILMDRVFRVFDEDNDGILNMKEWVVGLSKFLKGTKQEQMDYCFKVFDINGSGYISREGIHHMLKDCMVKSSTEEDAEENVKELVEIAMKKMDTDRDGRVSQTDFKAAVTLDGLLLEVFGKCLPGKEEVDKFSQKLSCN